MSLLINTWDLSTTAVERLNLNSPFLH